jgi:hypothetical protein
MRFIAVDGDGIVIDDCLSLHELLDTLEAAEPERFEDGLTEIFVSIGNVQPAGKLMLGG